MCCTETATATLSSSVQIDFDFPPLTDFPLARDLCKALLKFNHKDRLNSATAVSIHYNVCRLQTCTLFLNTQFCSVLFYAYILIAGTEASVVDQFGCIEREVLCRVAPC